MSDVRRITAKVVDRGWTVRISMEGETEALDGTQTMLLRIVEDATNIWDLTPLSSISSLEISLEKHDTIGSCEDTTKS